ncbi:hypothetical protein DFH09DRAFT_1327040 [Mycena vulgaris]|nr:hypothetical protein DFH09DRAFT_1327040 [Mycena vulgaris]
MPSPSSAVTEADSTLTMSEVLDEADGLPCSRCSLTSACGQHLHPRSDKCFPGYNPESKKLETEVLNMCIFGFYITEYMESRGGGGSHVVQAPIPSYLSKDIGSEDTENISSGAHAALHATFDPIDNSTEWKSHRVKYRSIRLTHGQRQDFKAGVDAAAEDEDDE